MNNTSLLLEMKSGKLIQDKRILGIIHDCIDNLRSLGYEIDDDIYFTWGNGISAFGVMEFPEYEGGWYSLVLNKAMQNDEEYSLKSTIYHELAHYICYKQQFEEGVLFWVNDKVYHNRFYDKANESNHGKRWKEVAKKISTATGIEIKVTGSFDLHPDVGKKANEARKYIIRCKNCGQEFKYAKQTSFVKDPNQKLSDGRYKYYCPKCHAEGQFEKINNESLTEELLLELNRSQLINKSKHSDNYEDESRGRNRWERRNRSSIDRKVDQYNKIDMNDLFKNDELKVGINVHGETNNYTVLIRYNGVLKEIQDQVKRNNNKIEFKCILIALQRVFNQGNVFVSCSCPDWQYRQAYSASKGGYNSGPLEIRSSDITNPFDTKGAGCKHVNLVLGNIDWIMKVSSVINNYIHYMKEHYERKYADLIFPKIFGMPYNKAVQMNLFDADDTLKDDADEISLSNRFGRTRTQFNKDRWVNNQRNFKFEKQTPQTTIDKPTLDLNMTRKVEEIKQDIKDGTK